MPEIIARDPCLLGYWKLGYGRLHVFNRKWEDQINKLGAQVLWRVADWTARDTSTGQYLPQYIYTHQIQAVLINKGRRSSEFDVGVSPEMDATLVCIDGVHASDHIVFKGWEYVVIGDPREAPMDADGSFAFRVCDLRYLPNYAEQVASVGVYTHDVGSETGTLSVTESPAGIPGPICINDVLAGLGSYYGQQPVGGLTVRFDGVTFGGTTYTPPANQYPHITKGELTSITGTYTPTTIPLGTIHAWCSDQDHAAVAATIRVNGVPVGTGDYVADYIGHTVVTADPATGYDTGPTPASYTVDVVANTLYSLPFTYHRTLHPFGMGWGWEGWQDTIAHSMINIDQLHADGCTGIRVRFMQNWYHSHYQAWYSRPNPLSPYNLFNATLCDAIVSRCASYGMVVHIDANHNFAPGGDQRHDTLYFTLANTHNAEWLSEWDVVAQRYEGVGNVALEGVNEYWPAPARDNVQARANEWIAHLRGAPSHSTLPLIWNWEWDSAVATLTDPLQNTAIGGHIYGTPTMCAKTHNTPTSWTDICNEPYTGTTTINSFSNKIFHTSASPYQFNVPDMQSHAPSGRAVFSEIGGGGAGESPDQLEHPRPFGLAWMMKAGQQSREHSVPLMWYTCSWSSSPSGQYLGRRPAFKQLAQTYFGRSFYVT